MKKIIIYFAFTLMSLSIVAQVETTSKLYKTLKVNDSLIFDSSFNTCNLEVLKSLIHDDLEFYHDKAGIIIGKDSFIENTKNGLCKSPNKLRRELLEETLEVFPLNENDGKLYGAIQKGTHRFYQDNKRTGIAYFTHLWIVKNDKWLLKRVLSYDHKTE